MPNGNNNTNEKKKNNNIEENHFNFLEIFMWQLQQLHENEMGSRQTKPKKRENVITF